MSQDRLPYEVLDRLHGDSGPLLSPEHHVHQAALVVTSKKSGTIRPFVRVHPRDLIIYQALLDALAPTIEGALSPRDRVGAYRQTLGDNNDAFAESPRNDEFRAGVSSAIEASGPVYVLQTDISGYFLGIRPGVLASELMEITELPDVVADLKDSVNVGGHGGGAVKHEARVRAESMSRSEAEAYLLGREEERRSWPDPE